MAVLQFRVPETLKASVRQALARLELSFDVTLSWHRLKRHQWRFWSEKVLYSLLLLNALFSLTVMAQPFLFKVFLVAVYTLGLFVPFTSQFVLPATPVFSWLVLFYSSQFIPKAYRPHIWVVVLPTLETVLYGANISDILTRYTNPFLDVLAWLPYGVGHFATPLMVAAALFIFAPPGAVKFFGAAFGFMNTLGVWCQIVFPCAPPWYELREGLMPANYMMKGSPGGLARIDALFHSNGYTNTFSNAPVVFGAFPSLHAGWATMEALFLTHFFPGGKMFYWGYTATLYWSTMYLTHHYLIDVVAGGSLAVALFYILLPNAFRHPTPSGTSGHSKGVESLSLSQRGDPELALASSYGYGGDDGNGGWEEESSDDERTGSTTLVSERSPSFSAKNLPGGAVRPSAGAGEAVRSPR